MSSPSPYSLILDLETLDTAPTSIITEMGVLVFNRNDFSEHACFSAEPCIFQQLAVARTASPETISFHHSKGTLPHELDSYHPKQAVRDLHHFIGLYAPHRIWIQGPDFDRPILEHFCNQFGEDLPWEFWRTRDTRTLWDTAFPGVKHDKRPHHAMPDCRATLADLTKALVALNRTEAA